MFVARIASRGDDLLERGEERALHARSSTTASITRPQSRECASTPAEVAPTLSMRAEQGIRTRLVEPALRDVARQPRADGVARAVHDAGVRVAQEHAMARGGGHLRDPSPHRAGAHHAHDQRRGRHVSGPGTAACASRRRRARLPRSRRCAPPRAAARPRARAAPRDRSSQLALNPRLIRPSARVGIAASRRARSKLGVRERRRRDDVVDSPHSLARFASSFSPSMASQFARCSPTRRGRMKVPPESGIRPIFENDWTNVAPSAASTMSQAKAMFAPAPAATPLTAQTNGFSVCRMRAHDRVVLARDDLAQVGRRRRRRRASLRRGPGRRRRRDRFP